MNSHPRTTTASWATRNPSRQTIRKVAVAGSVIPPPKWTKNGCPGGTSRIEKPSSMVAVAGGMTSTVTKSACPPVLFVTRHLSDDTRATCQGTRASSRAASRRLASSSASAVRCCAAADSPAEAAAASACCSAAASWSLEASRAICASRTPRQATIAAITVATKIPRLMRVLVRSTPSFTASNLSEGRL